tara:strand:+ start:115 stop:531 length:417 start_codon:yes stop_codon:yes gene_type:complete
MNPQLLFRLSLNQKHVGFMKYYSSSYYFFSVDMYGWSAKEISFDSKDLAIGIRDKNQQPLFEGDMFCCNHSIEPIYCIGWSNNHDHAPIFEINTNKVEKTDIKINSIDSKSLEFYAYLRDNKEILAMIPDEYHPLTTK